MGGPERSWNHEQNGISLETAGVGKSAATRLAKTDGVSLNQFIAVAVAEKVGVLKTAEGFLRRRAGKSKEQDLLSFTRKAGREAPTDSDRRRGRMWDAQPLGHCLVPRQLVTRLVEIRSDGSGGFGMLAELRPAYAGRGRVGHQDLSCSRLCDLGDLLHAPPLGRDEKQGALAGAAEHAREAAAVKVERLQYMTAFADTDAPFVGDIAVPDRVIGIEADPVGDAVAEVGPHTPRRQTSVRADVSKAVSLFR
jgi:hypothetical protein